MYFYFMGTWLSWSVRFTKAERWINKVERKVNKIRCRKHSLPIAFSCVFGAKLATRLSTWVISVPSTGRPSREEASRPCSEWRRRMYMFLTIFLGFYLLHYLVCYNITLHVIVVILAVRSLPNSSVTWLAEVSKFLSHASSTARTHPERLKTARRKENSEAAKLADFGLCCCNAELAKRESLSWVSNFLRTLVRKSWWTLSNSPGALCWISSSVAGLIPGEQTSATPRSVLQVSDRHLRRYPTHSECITWMQ